MRHLNVMTLVMLGTVAQATRVVNFDNCSTLVDGSWGAATLSDLAVKNNNVRYLPGNEWSEALGTNGNVCSCSEALHADEDNIINYIFLTYCWVDASGSAGGMVAASGLLILWLCLNFYLLAVAADKYLVPAMTALSDRMHLSPNVAGVTVLAFANGAPDFFTALAAFTGESTNDSLGIGAIVGAGFFITSLVLGSVGLTQEFTMYRRPFLRDVIMYLCSMLLLFSFLLDGEIHLYEAILLPAMYAVYVAFVVGGRYIYQTYFKNPSQEENDDTGDKILPGENNTDLRQRLSVSSSHGRSSLRQRESLSDTKERLSQGLRESLVQSQHSDEGKSYLLQGAEEICEQPKRAVGLLHEFVGWEERDLFWRVVLVVEFPFIVALRATCPFVEEETWSRSWNSATLLFSPQLLFYVFGGWSWTVAWAWSVAFLVAGAAAAAASFQHLAADNSLPNERVRSVFIILAFAMSCVWTFLVANELVGVFAVLGVVFDISDGIMGVTVLAWGNSLGDLFGDVALAREGHPRMAAAGCFGGPIFNLLIGTGIPFTIYTLSTGGPLILTKDNETNLGFVGLGVSLVMTLIVVPFNKFLLSREIAFLLLALYFAFLFLSILIEGGAIKPLL